MKFGVLLPNCALSFPWATAEELIEAAKIAEDLEFDSVWCNHHITPPKYLEKLIPRPKFFEPLITLSFIAAATEEIKIGTCVLVLPYKDPINIAMQVSALDNFSKGRLILGVGTGAYEEEFKAFHPHVLPSKKKAIMDESIMALRKLFTEEKTSFDGEFYKFGEIEMRPKPIQKPLPIWMGGNALAVQRRAGFSGEGWLPAALSIKEIKNGVERVRTFAEKAGRVPSKIEIAPEYFVNIAKTRQEAIKKYRESLGYQHHKSLRQSTLRGISDLMMKEEESVMGRNIMGTINDAVRQIEKFIDAGTTYLILAFTHTTKSIEEIVSGLKTFSKEVMPSFL